MGGQGPYWRSVEHLDRSSEAKNPQNAKKVKCDGWTDRQTDGWTDGQMDGWTNQPTNIAGCRVAKHATISEPVAQGQYVVSDTRCPALYVGDCR